MVGDQSSFFSLFDTEHKDREEDVFGPDIMGSSDSFLTHMESEVDKSLL